MTIDDKITKIYNALTTPRKLTYYTGTTSAVSNKQYTVLNIEGSGEFRRFSVSATYAQAEATNAALYTPKVTIIRDGYNLVTDLVASAATNTVFNGYQYIGGVFYLSDHLADLTKRPTNLTFSRYNSPGAAETYNQTYVLGGNQFTSVHATSSTDQLFVPASIPPLGLPFIKSLTVIFKYDTVVVARNATWGCWIDLEV